MQAEENDIVLFLASALGFVWGRGWSRTRVALSCVTAMGPGSTQKTETPEVHGTFSTRY